MTFLQSAQRLAAWAARDRLGLTIRCLRAEMQLAEVIAERNALREVVSRLKAEQDTST